MKKTIVFLITILTLTLVGQLTTTHAADMGGKTDLKRGDSKQELKEIMNQINKIATNVFEAIENKNRNNHWKWFNKFESSDCNVKYSKGSVLTAENSSFGNDSLDTILKFSLSDINSVEITPDEYIDYNVKLNVKGFEEKIRFNYGNESGTQDSVKLKMPNSNDAQKLKGLLEKAIKLCGEM